MTAMGPPAELPSWAPSKLPRPPDLRRAAALGCAPIRGSWAWANGAQERTRTFTAVKPLAPEASASTNSATWARAGYYGSVARLSNSRSAGQIDCTGDNLWRIANPRNSPAISAFDLVLTPGN